MPESTSTFPGCGEPSVQSSEPQSEQPQKPKLHNLETESIPELTLHLLQVARLHSEQTMRILDSIIAIWEPAIARYEASRKGG